MLCEALILLLRFGNSMLEWEKMEEVDAVAGSNLSP